MLIRLNRLLFIIFFYIVLVINFNSKETSKKDNAFVLRQRGDVRTTKKVGECYQVQLTNVGRVLLAIKPT